MLGVYLIVPDGMTRAVRTYHWQLLIRFCIYGVCRLASHVANKLDGVVHNIGVLSYTSKTDKRMLVPVSLHAGQIQMGDPRR